MYDGFEKEESGEKEMVIYEIPKFPFPKDVLIAVIMLAGSAIGGFLFASDYIEKRKLRYIVPSIVMLLLFLLFCYFFIESIKYGGSTEYIYAKKYYAGNFESVNGEIEELQWENVNGIIRKEFYVERVYLEQAVSALNWNEMFHKDKTIYEDGQNVEICYADKGEYAAYEGEKKIVKITLLEEEE